MQAHLSLTRDERRNFKSNIPGWGVDLDPKNRPGVPMDKAPMLGPESLYPNITPQQSQTVVFRSTEHGKMPPVFGTTCPPKGLSGLIRAKAYQFSEGQKYRWVMLLLADRIEMVEHLFLDLSKGHIPNLFKEMGLKSEWKYNRKAFVGRIALTTVTAIGLYLLFKSRDDD